MSAQIWSTDQGQSQMSQMIVVDSPEHKEAQQLKSIKRRFRWIYVLLVLLAIIVIVLLILLIILLVFYSRDRNAAATATAEEKLASDQIYSKSQRLWQNQRCTSTCTKKFDVPPLLVLSLDGFNAGYLARNLTQSLKMIADCGAHAPYIYGSYPTKTFPNHYAIMTGLYPESSGIVDNNMFDPTIKNDTVFFKNNTNPAWWMGEPMWNTVIKNGKKSACFYWPGSEVPVEGILPTYSMPYNKTMPFSRRVDQVNLALIYVDAMINYLMTSLYQRDLLDCINIMIVADHGMQQLYEDKHILLDQFFNIKGMRIFDAAVGRIMLENSTLDARSVVDSMKCQNGTNFRVYEPKDAPKRLHYAKSYRIGDVIVDSTPGAMVYASKKQEQDEDTELGDHGFDFRSSSMHAIFFGHGPGFKQGVTIQPFENIELYNLMADLMELPSRAPTNGTIGALYHVLSNPPQEVPSSMVSLSKCTKSLNFERCGGQCPQQLDENPVCLPEEVISAPASIATSLCAVELCNSTTIFDRTLHKPKFVRGIVTATSQIAERVNDCIIAINQLDDEVCNDPPASPSTTTPKTSSITTPRTSNTTTPRAANTTTPRTLSTTTQSSAQKITNVALFSFGNLDEQYIASQQVAVYDDFANGAWRDLQEMTLRYARNFGRLTVIAGVIYDYDHDGLADGPDALRILGGNLVNKNMSTHLFQILIRCDSGWIKDGFSCLDSTKANVLAFALPNQPKDINCLPSNDYLLQNTARVRDIELLTGLEFFTDRKLWVRDEAMRLRTYLPQELWQMVPTAQNQK